MKKILTRQNSCYFEIVQQTIRGARIDNCGDLNRNFNCHLINTCSNTGHLCAATMAFTKTRQSVVKYQGYRYYKPTILLKDEFFFAENSPFLTARHLQLVCLYFVRINIKKKSQFSNLIPIRGCTIA